MKRRNRDEWHGYNRITDYMIGGAIIVAVFALLEFLVWLGVI